MWPFFGAKQGCLHAWLILLPLLYAALALAQQVKLLMKVPGVGGGGTHLCVNESITSVTLVYPHPLPSSYCNVLGLCSPKLSTLRVC